MDILVLYDFDKPLVVIYAPNFSKLLRLCATRDISFFAKNLANELAWLFILYCSLHNFSISGSDQASSYAETAQKEDKPRSIGDNHHG